MYGAILAAICPLSDAYAAIIPDCAGPVEIAAAKVTRVEKNGVLVLSDGRAIALEGIRLPEEDSQRDQALGLLREMTADKSVTFTATAPKEDRYDRIRAQGFSGNAWLQSALLEKGLARVAIAPDRNECAPDFYEAETRARDRRYGLWAVSSNAPRQAEQVHMSGAPESNAPGRADRKRVASVPEVAARPAEAVRAPTTRESNVGRAAEPMRARETAEDNAPRRAERASPPEMSEGSFQLVEGWVTHVGQAGGRTFIDFGSNGRQSFSAIIQPEDRRAFRGFELEALEAHKIRIRGIVQDYRGRPEIALSNPAQIEVLN
jgi:endonuclease YncB( thermonuclease family)